jgi:hypothetical protein
MQAHDPYALNAWVKTTRIGDCFAPDHNTQFHCG